MTLSKLGSRIFFAYKFIGNIERRTSSFQAIFSTSKFTLNYLDSRSVQHCLSLNKLLTIVGKGVKI